LSAKCQERSINMGDAVRSFADGLSERLWERRGETVIKKISKSCCKKVGGKKVKSKAWNVVPYRNFQGARKGGVAWSLSWGEKQAAKGKNFMKEG